MAYAEWDACVGCSLDLWRWHIGDYTNKFKTQVMAFWNLRRLVDLHTQEAVNIAAEKKSKRKK